ncbi:MAG: DNA polymerase III subunit alpha, partial [Malacoplasma sp.]|nr:DNA polymerase III subunit alpha [Malacoplasma sp.]
YKDLIKLSSLKMEGDVNFTTINSLIKNCFVITEDIEKCQLDYSDGFSLNQKCKNPIASHQVYFQKKDDIRIWKSIRAIAEARLLDEYNDFHEYDECYLEKDISYSDEAIDNLNKLLDSCKWTLELNKNRYILDYAEIEHKNSRLMLQDFCLAGLKKQLKIKDGQVPISYVKRLKYELDVIDSMGFNNYFLVVQDYVNYAKNNGILVGPGRGSAAGSLVSYLLGITEIDPIKHNLIFERFLNPQRVTMPDIDVDFMDSRRNEVVEYLFNKYGKEHVAHIIIFQRIKIKMALRDVGRILDIDNKIVGKICSMVVDDAFGVDEQIKPSAKLQEAIENYPELFAIATKIINFPRQIGLHAAGVVLSNVNLNEVIPTQPSTDGILSTQYSMEYLEPLGLIKMDILGLSNLTSLDLILKKIEVNKGVKINLKDIELDNTDVFKYISAGNTTGIFQLESKGMTDVIRKVKPKSIEDISICSALFRPG